MNSAEPASVSARSSGPYWNDTSSSAAADDAGLDLAGQPPRLEGDGLAARQHRAGRPRQRHARRRSAVPRARTPACPRPRRVSGRSSVFRLKLEPGAVGPGAAGRNLVAVKPAAGDELALAADRPGERAHLAGEPQLVEHELATCWQRRSAWRGRPRCSAGRSTASRWRAPAAASRSGRCSSRPMLNCGATSFISVAPNLAAHQRPERRARCGASGRASRLPSPAGPMAMARKRHRRKRQQRGVDVAADPDLDADQPAGLGLEEGAVVVPADDMRTHQRRQQRQDQARSQYSTASSARWLRCRSAAAPGSGRTTSLPRAVHFDGRRDSVRPARQPSTGGVWRQICVRRRERV